LKQFSSSLDALVQVAAVCILEPIPLLLSLVTIKLEISKIGNFLPFSPFMIISKLSLSRPPIFLSDTGINIESSKIGLT
jgi:hypothetical protein